jgi:hypothetical protein
MSRVRLNIAAGALRRGEIFSMTDPHDGQVRAYKALSGRRARRWSVDECHRGAMR